MLGIARTPCKEIYEHFRHGEFRAGRKNHQFGFEFTNWEFDKVWEVPGAAKVVIEALFKADNSLGFIEVEEFQVEGDKWEGLAIIDTQFKVAWLLGIARVRMST